MTEQYLVKKKKTLHNKCGTCNGGGRVSKTIKEKVYSSNRGWSTQSVTGDTRCYMCDGTGDGDETLTYWIYLKITKYISGVYNGQIKSKVSIGENEYNENTQGLKKLNYE